MHSRKNLSWPYIQFRTLISSLCKLSLLGFTLIWKKYFVLSLIIQTNLSFFLCWRIISHSIILTLLIHFVPELIFKILKTVFSIYFKEYENYSFEELRYVSPAKKRLIENMLVRTNNDGTYTANWTPGSTGWYLLRVIIDGFEIGIIFFPLILRICIFHKLLLIFNMSIYRGVTLSKFKILVFRKLAVL